MNKLLEHAVISIKIGLEDYHSDDSNRIFSCVRNLYAGMILLFKSKLLDLSPSDSNEVLIKKKTVPVIRCGKLQFMGIGKNTIDIEDIEKYFESLEIKTKWNTIKQIQHERNYIEHYYANTNIKSLRGLIVKTVDVVDDFIKNEIKKDPRDLLTDTWDLLLEIKKEFLTDKQNRDDKIDEYFDFDDNQKTIIKNIYCSDCGSELLVPKEKTNNIDAAIMECIDCSNEIKVIDVFENTVDELYNYDSSKRIRDGYHERVQTCPECNKNAFDIEKNICYHCSYEGYTECKQCGSGLDIDEQEYSGLCSYCSHKNRKWAID